MLIEGMLIEGFDCVSGPSSSPSGTYFCEATMLRLLYLGICTILFFTRVLRNGIFRGRELLSYSPVLLYSTILSCSPVSTVHIFLTLDRPRIQATVNAIPEASPYAIPPGSTSLRLLLGHKTHLDLCLCYLGSLKIYGPSHCTL